jgi:hypothetical protein
MARYHAIVCDVLRGECLHYGERCGNDLSWEFLEQRLHNEPNRLRSELMRTIEEAPGDVDAVLLFYGLCSNGVEGIRALAAPLVIPRAHDCITLFLGSRERYDRYFVENPGTYWFTAGWIDTGAMPSPERYEELVRQYAAMYGEENAEYLVEMTEGSWVRHYHSAAFVDLGIRDATEYVAYTRRCAEHFGWGCDLVAGDPRLIESLLAGEWDPHEFLVVPPGRKVVATHDARIIDWPR